MKKISLVKNYLSLEGVARQTAWEKEYLKDALIQARGDKSKAAIISNMTYRTINNWLQRFPDLKTYVVSQKETVDTSEVGDETE